MRKITVLVGMYKAGDFLQAKIDNLLLQTMFEDCNIILLNCQNFEGESDIYKDFASSHKNITVFCYPTHRGLYSTWNDGIKSSQSDYIVNANVDDMWHQTYLERLTTTLDQNVDYAVAYTHVLTTCIKNQSNPDIWTNEGGLSTQTFPGGTMGPCPVWRRSLHDKYGYFDDFQVISDGLMWQKWRRGGEKFYQIPEPLVLYFHNPNSLERRMCPHTKTLVRDKELKEIGVHA